MYLESLHFAQVFESRLFYIEPSSIHFDAEEGDGANSRADESELDAVGRGDGRWEGSGGGRVNVVVLYRLRLGVGLGENCEAEER